MSFQAPQTLTSLKCFFIGQKGTKDNPKKNMLEVH